MSLPKALVAAAALAGVSSAAHAACSFSNFDFFPERNHGVVVEANVQAGTSCNHNFREGPGYRFTNLAIDAAPSSGTLRKTGAARFTYTPAKGFTGKDAYGVKVCAVKGGQSGCAGIYYVATVK